MIQSYRVSFRILMPNGIDANRSMTVKSESAYAAKRIVKAKMFHEGHNIEVIKCEVVR